MYKYIENNYTGSITTKYMGKFLQGFGTYFPSVWVEDASGNGEDGG